MTTTASLALREVDGFALATFDDEAEPRLRDTDLAVRLGYDQPRSIRKLIERNRPEIEQFGAIHSRSTVERQSTGNGASREFEVVEFWLTFEQAMDVAVLSRTERASDVRVALVRLAAKVRRGELAPATPSALDLVREAVDQMGLVISGSIAQVMGHVADTSRQIAEVRDDVAAVRAEVAGVRASVDKIARGKRREITATTKADHARAARLFGGLCPCCSVERVLADDGSVTGEFDHFFAAQAPDVDHTWLICKRCHADFTYGRVDRTARTPEFAAYQNRRRRLPGRQPGLPGVN